MKTTLRPLSLFFAVIIFLNSCAGGPKSSGANQNQKFAETVFQARLFQGLLEGQDLYLEIVDEVTGIALNPTRFKMEAIGSAEYAIRVPLAVGSLVRYRYVRNGVDNTIEKNPLGQTVLYRMYKVNQAGQVNDLVAGWDQQPYSGETGELSGYIFDLKTDAPLGEILVSINGLQTYTSFDGFYEFTNVPAGEFPISAIHPNGLYEDFQQKAIIAHNSVTPASFGMQPAKMVDVTFEVSVPDDTEPEGVIRLLGNTRSLGNSFSELPDGSSLFPALSPALVKSKPDVYSLTLRLPAGLDLRYKYSLGDGFINAEHNDDTTFRVRQLIIQNKDMVIRDTVESWYSSGAAPVRFRVSAPDNTPSSDSLSIQFNPYAWMQPIPMWKTAENEWAYTLYGPFDYLDQAQYRFCRNGQCGIADDSVTMGPLAMGYLLDLSNGTPLTINYPISQWFGVAPRVRPFDDVNRADSLLIKGFEFSSPFDRKWLPYLDVGLIEAAVNGGNWIFFNPTWTFETEAGAGLNPATDPFADEILAILNISNQAGLNFALYPKLSSRAESVERYWSESALSYNWWQGWFDDYRRFILNYADFAALHGINTIIIGGDTVSPAFPNGTLSDGSFANTPYDSAEKWADLVSQVRARFNGQIGFALPYSETLDQPPAFTGSLDFIYLELDAPLTSITNPSVSDLRARVAQILDNDIYKLYAITQKPIILGLSYFAMDGAASGCLNLNTPCEAVYENRQGSALAIDGDEQADIYLSILQEVSTRPWVLGVVSQGYNPSVAVEDASQSVFGKPAMQVLSAFFR